MDNIKNSLREKCSYSKFFCSVFSRIWTRKTPNTDTFHVVTTFANKSPYTLFTWWKLFSKVFTCYKPPWKWILTCECRLYILAKCFFTFKLDIIMFKFLVKLFTINMECYQIACPTWYRQIWCAVIQTYMYNICTCSIYCICVFPCSSRKDNVKFPDVFFLIERTLTKCQIIYSAQF